MSDNQKNIKESKNNEIKNEPDKNNLTYTLEKIQNNVFHVKTQNQLSDSILNFFTMAIGFLMFGFIHAQIIKTEKTLFLFYGSILIAGIAQIVLGVYEWYKAKTLTLLTNILFGFLFISWFLKYLWVEKNEDKNEYDEGALYIMWFLLSIFIIVGVKNKGIIYSLDYLAVTVGFVFLFIAKYVNQDWIQKVYGYIFIVSGALFWLTGLLRFIDSSFLNNTFALVKE